MGNRAVVTMSVASDAPCIYLHWNGGKASVQGFLKAAKAMKLDTTEPRKFFDEFAKIIAKYFFGCNVGMHIYRETYGRADTDNWDNGVFIIDQDLKIVGREFKRNTEETDDLKAHAICTQMLENRGKAIRLGIEVTTLEMLSAKAQLNKNLHHKINLKGKYNDK